MEQNQTSQYPIPNLQSDWGENPTDHLPQSGEQVQAFIKAQLAAAAGAVKYDAPQTLSEQQKQQARENIGVFSKELLGTLAYDATTYPTIQPTSYDSTTGQFATEEDLPAWVTSSGVKATMRLTNFADFSKTLKFTATDSKFTITKVDSRHFTLSGITVQSNVVCSSFKICFGGIAYHSVIPLSSVSDELFCIKYRNLNSLANNYGLPLKINGSNISVSQGFTLKCASLGYSKRATVLDEGMIMLYHRPLANKISVISGRQVALKGYDGTNTPGNVATPLDPMFEEQDLWGYTTANNYLGVHITEGCVTDLTEFRIYRLNNYTL